MTKRNLSFILGTLAAATFYWKSLRALAMFSADSNIYSYVGAIPLISVVLIYLERGRIFSRARFDLRVGLIFALIGVTVRTSARFFLAALSPEGTLALTIFSFLMVWVGVFVWCYGTYALRSAGFQALFLLLMIPIPHSVSDQIIYVLRGSSAQAAAVMLKVGGVPVFRNEFRLSLPGTDVEVARECSGIRSGFALVITSLLIGYLFLRSFWNRLWLVLAAVPVTIFKNGLRIVVIYLLTVHTSMDSLTLWVHHYGGIPISFLGLSIMGSLAISLRSVEENSAERRGIKDGGMGFRGKASKQTLDLSC